MAGGTCSHCCRVACSEHVLAADGVFGAQGTFTALPPVPEALLAEGFRQEVLAFLVKERAIADELGVKMLGWRHGGGFSAHNRVRVGDLEGRMKLAGYMIRAPITFPIGMSTLCAMWGGTPTERAVNARRCSKHSNLRQRLRPPRQRSASSPAARRHEGGEGALAFPVGAAHRQGLRSRSARLSQM